MVSMLGRVISTLGVWSAITVLGGLLVASVRYTTTIQIGERPVEIPNFVEGGVAQGATTIMTPIFQTVTEVMPGTWQLVVAVLMFMLIAGAIRVTRSIWESNTDQQAAAAVSSRKMKREQEERMRRILSRMDDEDRLAALEALEAERIGDDGERVSMAELLQTRRG
jgi:hypothetical protein